MPLCRALASFIPTVSVHRLGDEDETAVLEIKMHGAPLCERCLVDFLLYEYVDQSSRSGQSMAAFARKECDRLLRQDQIDGLDFDRLRLGYQLRPPPRTPNDQREASPARPPHDTSALH